MPRGDVASHDLLDRESILDGVVHVLYAAGASVGLARQEGGAGQVVQRPLVVSELAHGSDKAEVVLHFIRDDGRGLDRTSEYVSDAKFSANKVER